MATRSTGFAILASRSVQEAHDMALIAQSATLKSRVPFLHFFDGFRTSHEVNKLELVDEEVMREMIDEEAVAAHRARGLNPDKPFIRGTAQNPDTYFQGREAVNPFYAKCPDITQQEMDKFAKLTGRQYHLFDYEGAPDAERVIVIMGSGGETVEETAKYLINKGEKVGVVNVRLYRPFDTDKFLKALPKTVKAIAVLDRTKEAGADGEPLYKDIAAAIFEAAEKGTSPFKGQPIVVGGRYGLSSKEFNPGMAKGVFDELKKAQPMNSFSVGIHMMFPSPALPTIPISRSRATKPSAAYSSDWVPMVP
jgi:pyruvate-ferredoxin/flavodoxin oxidoreductase